MDFLLQMGLGTVDGLKTALASRTQQDVIPKISVVKTETDVTVMTEKEKEKEGEDKPLVYTDSSTFLKVGAFNKMLLR